jgi:hypothetical protein
VGEKCQNLFHTILNRTRKWLGVLEASLDVGRREKEIPSVSQDKHKASTLLNGIEANLHTNVNKNMRKTTMRKEKNLISGKNSLSGHIFMILRRGGKTSERSNHIM